MPIKVNLDVMMAKRKIGLMELAEKIDISPANLSILKNNKARAIRFSTLEAICRALSCQPADILEYEEDEDGKDLQNKLLLYALISAVSIIFDHARLRSGKCAIVFYPAVCLLVLVGSKEKAIVAFCSHIHSFPEPIYQCQPHLAGFQCVRHHRSLQRYGTGDD